MKTNLPVKGNGEKTEPFIAVTPAKHSRDSRVVWCSKAEDRHPSEKGEYPFREEFPNKDPGGSELGYRSKDRDRTRPTLRRRSRIPSVCGEQSGHHGRMHQTWKSAEVHSDKASLRDKVELLVRRSASDDVSPDQGKLTSQCTTDAVTKELTGKQQQDGSCSIGGDVIVQALDGKDLRCKGRVCCCASHDNDESILFFVERILDRGEIYGMCGSDRSLRDLSNGIDHGEG